MDEETKSQIELEVRRILDNEDIKLSRNISEQVDKHRSFLQTQFKTLTWSIGILFIFATGTFGWLFGKSYESTKEQIIQEVEQKIIEYRIVDSFKKRLNEQINLAVTKPELIESIGNQVREIVSKQVEAKTDKIIAESLEKEIKKISEQDLSQLVERAVKDSLAEIQDIRKRQLRIHETLKRVLAQFSNLGGYDPDDMRETLNFLVNEPIE